MGRLLTTLDTNRYPLFCYFCKTRWKSGRQISSAYGCMGCWCPTCDAPMRLAGKDNRFGVYPYEDYTPMEKP